jgi:hypothetical protein
MLKLASETVELAMKSKLTLTTWSTKGYVH